ncbi:substrate-binding domain-containing protein [Vibrio sp. CAIM 722]|uniref:Substrate-binding domain-containing protein n=1 Tax=Vibrio eleionomae TaxID=2653505 RepID=A0A7X4LJX1_9VIBR|nr:LacI family DNA-binding transcriptional regulator [Vibrio eleionomae]MZI92982.1 substrate-binding domain-containing protein [Vibrio eleionomae]
MVTMLDVAKKAGVSKSTVSRILSGSVAVSEKAKEAVYQAIEETGYRPNLLARQLATKKTSYIGFVMTNVLYDGPYFSTIVYNAASFSESNGYQLVLADGKHSAEEERNAINFLLDMKCAGIVVYPTYLSEEEMGQIIEQSETPIIVINRHVPSHPEIAFVADHYQCAVDMMEYIISQGHQHIAFIRGTKGSSSGEQRFKAYKNVLERHQIPFNEQLVVQGAWRPDDGYEGVKELTARKQTMTAILAGNDEMAFGAMKALNELGFRIPQDISIAGFDNIAMSNYVTPALTTVGIPFDRILQKGILYLIGDERHSDVIDLNCDLIIRDSVCPPHQ